MTAWALRVDVPGLDRQIVRALASLRSARTRRDRAPTPANVLAERRAEAHLDALLDSRCAFMDRAANPPRALPR